MGRVPSVFLSLILLSFSGYPSSAGADPIRITSGVVEAGFDAIGQPLNAETLDLSGGGLRIVSSLEDEVAFVYLAAVPTVAPGAVVDLSGVLRVEDVVGEFFDGSFGLVTAPFTLSFAVLPMRLACSEAGAFINCGGLAPFTLDAELIFTPLGGDPVRQRLVGTGTAEGRFSRSESFASGAVSYVFDPSPVPEPATLTLFASGLIVAGARAWRRRRADRIP